MDNDFTPNWEMIQSSDVWKTQVQPFLKAMLNEGLEQRAGVYGVPFGGGQLPTLEEYHCWRGWCAALKAVLEMPGEMVEINREKRAQENTDVLVSERQSRVGRFRRESA